MSPLTVAAVVVLLEALAFGAVFPLIGYCCQQLGGGPTWVSMRFARVNAPRVLTALLAATIPLFRPGRRTSRRLRRVP